MTRKRTLSQFFAMLLALTMVLSIMPVSVLAEDCTYHAGIYTEQPAPEQEIYIPPVCDEYKPEYLCLPQEGLCPAERNGIKYEQSQLAIDQLTYATIPIGLNIPYPGWEDAMNAAIANIAGRVTNPRFGNEWSVMALARSNFDVAPSFIESYLDSVFATVQGPRATTGQSTDTSRVIIGLSSLGIDARDINGHNLVGVGGLADLDWATAGTINNAIYALRALDTNKYELPTEGDNITTRDALIQSILGRELAAGGWALFGNAPDPDVTAMAITSLAPYYDSHLQVGEAIDRALNVLSGIQLASGGFRGAGLWAVENSQSSSQVIVALTALGIDPQADGRFVTDTGNNPVTALLAYQHSDGGFRNGWSQVLNNSPSDAMATNQAAYALVAYWRFVNGMNSLNDMRDAFPPVADRTALLNAITSAEALTESNYTPVSWDAMQTVLVTARNVRDNTNAPQTEIDNAAVNLRTAIDALVLLGIQNVDMTALYNEIARAETLNASGFTADTWAALQSALAEAKNIRNTSSTDQFEIDIAAQNLRNAISALEAVGVQPRAFISVVDPNARAGQTSVFLQGQWLDMQPGDTVYSLLRRTGLDISSRGSAGLEGMYVEAINGWGEFSDGPLSGWMYRVNGNFPGFSSSLYVLNDGDSVEWLFTRNLGNDLQGGGAIGGGGSGSGDNAPAQYVSRADLNNVIAQAEGKAQENYTPDSWAALQAALTLAIQMRDNTSATQAQVDQAANALYTAIDALDRHEVQITSPQMEERETVDLPVRQVEEEWVNPFHDVAYSDWFYRSVQFVYSHGIMNGTAYGEFSPNANLSRGMIVTMLWRLEGMPNYVAGSNFRDVNPAHWYSNAVNWAYGNGIINGYGNGLFGPNDHATREQIAVILHNYVQFKDVAIRPTSLSTDFYDEDQISYWAYSAMAWAIGSGVISGCTETTDPPTKVCYANFCHPLKKGDCDTSLAERFNWCRNTLAPTGTATRAEAARMLQNFLIGPYIPAGETRRIDAAWEVAKEASLDWIISNVEPAVGSVGGEWAVIALARAGRITAGDPWLASYFDNLDYIVAAVNNLTGLGNSIHHPPSVGTFPSEMRRWTDFQRVTLALTALGLDAANYNGSDITQVYSTFVPINQRHALNQTVNVDTFALIALDSNSYSGDREKFIESILDSQRDNGTWGLAAFTSPLDLDTTAMAVQALAPYYNSNAYVAAAIDTAITWLRSQTFTDPEGVAQMIVALTALGSDFEDDAEYYVNLLLRWFDPQTGGFIRPGQGVNMMATEQAAYALVAYYRFVNGMTSLYDMSDMHE